MRFLRETMIVAAVLGVYGVVQAFLGARELERVAPTTRMPNLPMSNLVATLGLAVMLVLYAGLGRAIAQSGATSGAAAVRGGIAGCAAGLIAGIAQALLQANFFRDVLLSYSLSDAYLGVVLLAIVIVEPIAGAISGAIVAWLAYVLLRPARRIETASS